MASAPTSRPLGPGGRCRRDRLPKKILLHVDPAVARSTLLPEWGEGRPTVTEGETYHAVPRVHPGGRVHAAHRASPARAVRADGAFVEEATKAGVIVATGGIAPTSAGAKIALKDGNYTVVDGPFVEAKEIVGGWALMECRDLAEAVEWSKRFLAVLGEGEVRIRPVSG